MVDITQIWHVIDSYFRDTPYYLTKHHLDSYNDFISNQIPSMISQSNPLRIFKDHNPKTNTYRYEIEIYFGGLNGDKIYISKPTIYDHALTKEDIKAKPMFPNEARLRNMNYSANICCDILLRYQINISGKNETHDTTLHQVNLGKIPIMLHSKYCALHQMPPGR